MIWYCHFSYKDILDWTGITEKKWNVCTGRLITDFRLAKVASLWYVSFTCVNTNFPGEVMSAVWSQQLRWWSGKLKWSINAHAKKGLRRLMSKWLSSINENCSRPCWREYFWRPSYNSVLCKYVNFCIFTATQMNNDSMTNFGPRITAANSLHSSLLQRGLPMLNEKKGLIRVWITRGDGDDNDKRDDIQCHCDRGSDDKGLLHRSSHVQAQKEQIGENAQH